MEAKVDFSDIEKAFKEPEKWTLEHALRVVCDIESFCPVFGFHVALTGGVLYKDGPRKDLDLLFYRIRQVAEPDFDGLIRALSQRGCHVMNRFGWMAKAHMGDYRLDLFFPECDIGGYPEHYQ